MVQGITAFVPSHVTYRLKPGDRCLVHAAAGGVGLLLCQIAKQAGAFVIGTTSTAGEGGVGPGGWRGRGHPLHRARLPGRGQAHHRRQGVNVVYDSVGKDTFDRSLECLAPLGCW